VAQQALVDTTVLYAAANQAERARHQTGLSIVRRTDAGELPQLVVPRVVLVETINGVQRDLGAHKAEDLLSRLEASPSFELANHVKADWEHGRDTFRRIDVLSLVDAMQVVQARRQEIRYIDSFDPGFDVVGDLDRLAKPVDPFSF
jgi:predicted nucleic acid-binding protein